MFRYAGMIVVSSADMNDFRIRVVLFRHSISIIRVAAASSDLLQPPDAFLGHFRFHSRRSGSTLLAHPSVFGAIPVRIAPFLSGISS